MAVRKDSIVKILIAVLLLSTESILLLHQALYHGHLRNFTGGDGGVYYAASLNLIHGILPYRNFVFLQPPAIMIILSPFALLADLTSTRMGFEAARLLVYLVEFANCILLLWIIRWLSPIRIAIGLGVMALSVDMLETSGSILLEPFLITFCLGGIALIFERDKLTLSKKRVFISGLLFGLGGATKAWAIVPVVVLLITVLTSYRENIYQFSSGIVAGFGATVLPFILLCPRQLFDQVILTQAMRTREPPSTIGRLLDLVGFPGFSQLLFPAFFVTSSAALLLLGFGLTMNSQLRRFKRHRSPLEKFVLWTVGTIAAMLLLARPFFFHYPAFLTPFVAILLSIQPYSHPTTKNTRDQSSLTTPLVITAITCLMLATAVLDYYRAQDPPPGTDWIAVEFMNYIPSGSCLLAWPVSFALLSNKYTGDSPKCPHVVDWYGTERYYARGKSVSHDALTSNQQFQDAVQTWVKKSGSIVLGFANLGIDANNIRFIETHFKFMNSDPSFAYRSVFNIALGVRVPNNMVHQQCLVCAP